MSPLPQLRGCGGSHDEAFGDEALGQGWDNPRKKPRVNRVVNPLEIPDEEPDVRKGVKSVFNPSSGSSEMRYLTVDRRRTSN